MLFSSFEFIFLFLPITLAFFFFLNHRSRNWGLAWLAFASLFFYGWWKTSYLLLLGASILCNYFIGEVILDARREGLPRRAKRAMALGVTLNIALLLYYKYTNFFIGALNGVTGWHIPNPPIELPLGISFFTFTQTAYLVDCCYKTINRYNMVNYVLFVTYFPHLIAGPILHHSEMMPQFNYRKPHTLSAIDLSVGLSLFAMGLFKKVIIADNIAFLADIVFKDASAKHAVGFYQAWKGSLAYTLQLYFDFSGYSDMAIGLSRMIGIRLPINFHSPYKARSASEFWQRWHRTLSRFIRDYLYIPLGGNRKGLPRKYLNLLITMFLAGLWHGAGWTFMLWGLMHGVFLAVNHLWRDLKRRLGLPVQRRLTPLGLFWGLLTFLAVNFAWVMFRADSVSSGCTVLRSMFQFGQWRTLAQCSRADLTQFAVLAALLAWVFLAPNTQQVMRRYAPAIGLYRGDRHFLFRAVLWKPNLPWALLVAGLLSTSVLAVLTSYKSLAFLYFQF